MSAGRERVTLNKYKHMSSPDPLQETQPETDTDLLVEDDRSEDGFEDIDEARRERELMAYEEFRERQLDN